jgi:CDP-glycerol glycerophosphotransferase (TagB/SpsB family)
MVSRKHSIFLALSLLAISGCSVNMKEEANSALKMFNKDVFYERAITQTKSSQIINSFETKAKLTATYLNKIDKNYKDAEYFFVGIFIVNDDDDLKKAGLNNKNFRLFMNHINPKTKTLEQTEAVVVETLKNDDEIVKKMPHTESWSRYYIVKFPTQKSADLTLEYSSEYGKATLNFSKL